MTLLDRVRQALTPSFRVDRELGRGAMGVVFLCHDPTLDRPVAIKVLKPEVATAVTVERFLREARLLARLRHPNIIQIHQAGTVGGLLYFVMDYAAGETLATRLARGALPVKEAEAVAADLLDALAAAHRLGIIHRDVKPGNVFLVEGRAYLADFGIARSVSASDSEPQLTVEGRQIGTPAYMAPEQLAGEPADASSDIYATGLLLYECFSGRRWTAMQAPDHGDWSGVPPRIAGGLRKAMALDRPERWQNAVAMRKALAGAPARSRWVPALAIGTLGVAAVAIVLTLRRPSLVERQVIAIADFTTASQADRAVASSLAVEIAAGLRGAPDFEVRHVSARARERAGLLLSGTLRQVGDSLKVAPVLEVGGMSRQLRVFGAPAARRDLLVDSLTTELLVQVLELENRWIPKEAGPRTSQGLSALIAAERAYFRAQRDSAARLYLAAFAVDSTCVLCLYRFNDLRRFLEEELDPAHVARVRREIDRFPPNYQDLIAAEQLPNPARLEALEKVTRTYREFPDGWYRFGEEVYNRGPLWGWDRYEALEFFRKATLAGPPSGFDVITLLIAKRDSAGARDAINYVARHVGTARDAARVGLAEVAFAMRFAGLDSGVAVARRGLQRPGVGDLTEAAAGPRVLHAYDLPDGAVALGRAFEAFEGRPLFVTSGRIAQVTGLVAMGQLQALQAVRRKLEQSGQTPWVTRYPIFLTVLLLALDDTNEARAGRAPMEAALTELESEPEADRWTAAWMLAVLAYRLGDTLAAKRHLRFLADEPSPQPRRRLVGGWAAAAQGNPEEALTLTDSLVRDLTLIEGDAHGDPFLRAGVKLSRAEWLLRAGRQDRALRELRWHQHFHLTEYPVAAPLSAETDWALGTFARWRLATWLDDGPGVDEVCRALGAVARHWMEGDRPYRERARQAGERFQRLNCHSA